MKKLVLGFVLTLSSVAFIPTTIQAADVELNCQLSCIDTSVCMGSYTIQRKFYFDFINQTVTREKYETVFDIVEKDTLHILATWESPWGNIEYVHLNRINYYIKQINKYDSRAGSCTLL